MFLLISAGVSTVEGSVLAKRVYEPMFIEQCYFLEIVKSPSVDLVHWRCQSCKIELVLHFNQCLLLDNFNFSMTKVLSKFLRKHSLMWG